MRGHRDDAKHCLVESKNPGNLHAFLALLAKCGKNATFNQHLDFPPANATYRSKTRQNELVKICGSLIKERILNEVKVSKFFVILADEAADVSNVEQMAMVLRFIDSNSHIGEEFLAFFPCVNGLSGASIAKTIEDWILSMDLDMQYCRGQCYDGAGNMAGKCSGAAIQQTYQQAKYVHFCSHVLNLCVASTYDLPET